MTQSGFREIQHTADLSMMVWAPTLEELYFQAARGMYDLIGVKSISLKQYYRNISLSAADQEGMLVSFLTELLYFLEQEKLFFDEFVFTWVQDTVSIGMSGSISTDYHTEIKAVTYNDLKIKYKKGVYTTTMVFDI